MAVLVWGLKVTFVFVVTKVNFVCSIHNMGPLDNEGKRLVSVIWRCEIIPPGETRPKCF